MITHGSIMARWKPLSSFFRLRFSPRSQRWQNLHAAPLVQPSLKTKAQGLHLFRWWPAEPTVGITLAVAIAIHNIPEGLCVADRKSVV